MNWCKMCRGRPAVEATGFCGDNCEDRYASGERSTTHVRDAVEKAVREEREAVVQHLRSHAAGYGRACAEAHELQEKADQIARGDHRK